MIAIFLLAFTLSLFSFGTTPAAAGDVAGVSTHLFLTVLRDYDHDAAFSVTYTDALGTHTKPYHAGMEVTAWSPVTITCTNHHVHDWSIDADVQEATIVGVGGITYPGGTGIHVKGTNTIKAFATNFGLHYINIVVILGEGNDNGGDNADTIGWLRIDGTNINNVVMFAPDTPGKYLHMDFYGKWSYRGTLYVAENCDVRTADNILIYGHHMKDGSMFGSLISYKDAAFRAAHPIVQFDTLYASHSYEVVAAIETEIPAEGSDAFRYYDCIGTDPEQFAQYCTFIEQNRCYDTGITIQPGDRLLTLSTCAYHTANGRFLVVARQVD